MRAIKRTWRCPHQVPGSKRFFRTGNARVAVLGGQKKGPSLDLNFLTGGAIDPRITFTRASGASYFDGSGTLQTAASNVPRIDYGPTPIGGVTNYIRNSAMVGAAGGTPPANWSVSTSAGMSSTIVGTGTEAGILYVDVRIFGTPFTNTACSVNLETATGIAALTGQTWTETACVRLVGGSFANTSLSFGLKEETSGGALVLGTFIPVANATAAALNTQRQSATRILSGGGTVAALQPTVSVGITSGASVDVTLRIGATQAEKGSTANAFVPTSGAIATAGATPLGLLIEEARTNSIRNPRAEGSTVGVIGSGGVLPTNWSLNMTGTVAVTISGPTLINGIPCLDLRFNGTTSSPGYNLYLETPTGVASAQNQVWAFSPYVALVAGSLANVTLINPIAVSRPSGTQIFAGSDIRATLTNTLQRLTPAVTQANATDTSLQPGFIITHPSGVVIDFTLRIGAPQLELGAFATSLIMPSVGTPAASTRAADVATMPAPVTGASAGSSSMVVQALVNQAAAGAGLVSMDDGTTANRIILRSNAGNLGGVFVTASSNTAQPVTIAVPLGAVFKFGGVFQPNLFTLAANANTPVSVAGTQPSGLTTLRIGQNASGSGFANGWIQRVRLWKRAQSTQELQANTV